MSILLDPPNLTRRATPGKATGWLVAGVVVWTVLSAFVAAQLIPREMAGEGGGWDATLFALGPVRTFRRIQLLTAAVLAPLLLKRLGWVGLRDVGWTSRQTRGERKKDVLVWFVTGLAVCLVLGMSVVFRGSAEWLSNRFLGWIHFILIDALVSGILVTIVFETVVRGIFYRTLAEAWSSWTASLVVSGVFAWAATPAASAPPVDQGTLAVIASVCWTPLSSLVQLQTFLSLFLLGLILCRFVYHKGDIWGAVGLHAAIRIGLCLFVLTGSEPTELSRMQNAFYSFAASTLWFPVGLLLFWGWVEWRHRKKLTSYGRVHF